MNGLHIILDAEHTAMLDALCSASGGGMTRTEMAKSLLVAVLDDDAAAHQACGTDAESKVIELRNWRGARR